MVEKMNEMNPIKRLIDTSSNMEIWWDSSPLLYRQWLEGAGKEFKSLGLFKEEGNDGCRFSSESLLQGATTNQPLTWQAIEQEAGSWHTWLQAEGGKSTDSRGLDATWRLFIEVAARGAAMLEPIFEASKGRRGQICCQVDPRMRTDQEAMLAQARRIHAARPNMMVKLPGTKEGIESVRLLTAEGIPTNVTLGFTVSQLVAVGEAAQKGLADAKNKGTDLSSWRSCATMMLGRYEDAPPMKAQAAEVGVDLSDADLRWAGIAIFHKAYRLFKERSYPRSSWLPRCDSARRSMVSSMSGIWKSLRERMRC